MKAGTRFFFRFFFFLSFNSVGRLRRVVISVSYKVVSVLDFFFILFYRLGLFFFFFFLFFSRVRPYTISIVYSARVYGVRNTFGDIG